MKRQSIRRMTHFLLLSLFAALIAPLLPGGTTAWQLAYASATADPPR